MISFQLSEEQNRLREKVRAFVEAEVLPVEKEYDEKQEIPWGLIKKCYDQGLMNLKVPREYGGAGVGQVTFTIFSEEFAYGCLGILGTLGASDLCLTPLLLAGTEEQKKRFLPEFCSAPHLGAFALTEREAGSDVASMTTTARLIGDQYVINGKKCFITNGGVASYYTVFASEALDRGAKGISAFFVPGDTPGLLAGKKENKMGIRASHVGEVIFEDVRVPKENLLGRTGDGFRIAMQTLDQTRTGTAAGAVGVARRALEEAIRYSKERIQFGKPIAANQAIQFMLSDMAVQVEAARLLVYWAAEKIDRGERASAEGAMAKFYAGDMAMQVTQNAVQIFGGYGYMHDYPVEKLMRDAKILQIYEGTNQITRLVVARALLS